MSHFERRLKEVSDKLAPAVLKDIEKIMEEERMREVLEDAACIILNSLGDKPKEQAEFEAFAQRVGILDYGEEA